MNNKFLSKLDGMVADLTVSDLNHELLTTESEELNIVNQYFDSVTCSNKEIEKLIYEVIGYSITNTSKLCKAFIFKGSGRNGKSKIFRIIENLLISDQCSHEHLENLCGTKAGGKSTVKKLKYSCVNISEDQKQPKYINTSLITRIISGETITIGDEDIKPNCTMLFSVNEVIDFKETGLHITDRIVVIPFNNTFTDSNNNRDINIEDKLCQKKSLQIIATKALEAFELVLERGHFSIPQIVIDETTKYFLECNTVAEFCGLYPIKTIIQKATYYNEYKKWCTYNNRDCVNNANFGKEVLSLGYRAERYSFNNDRKTYYAAPYFINSDCQTIYDNYLKEIGITRETASAYTFDELSKIYENMQSFESHLCEELYKSESKDEQSL